MKRPKIETTTALTEFASDLSQHTDRKSESLLCHLELFRAKLGGALKPAAPDPARWSEEWRHYTSANYLQRERRSGACGGVEGSQSRGGKACPRPGCGLREAPAPQAIDRPMH